jgi:hypothetical protein
MIWRYGPYGFLIFGALIVAIVGVIASVIEQRRRSH